MAKVYSVPLSIYVPLFDKYGILAKVVRRLSIMSPVAVSCRFKVAFKFLLIVPPDNIAFFCRAIDLYSSGSSQPTSETLSVCALLTKGCMDEALATMPPKIAERVAPMSSNALIVGCTPSAGFAPNTGLTIFGITVGGGATGTTAGAGATRACGKTLPSSSGRTPSMVISRLG